MFEHPEFRPEHSPIGQFPNFFICNMLCCFRSSGTLTDPMSGKRDPRNQYSMHRTITTLHEYRTLYPESAPIPTLTQSGLLGLLLDRQRYKAAAWPGAGPDGNPSALRHAAYVSVSGGR